MPRFRNPIGAWLRSIRHHSARRESTRWTRAMDTALFASPALGALVAMILHHAELRSEVVTIASGGLERNRAGDVAALFGTDGTNPSWRAAPIGSFWIEREDTFGGWPLPTTVRRSPPAVLLRIFTETTTEPRLPTERDAELVQAIDRTIARGVDEFVGLRSELALPSRITNRWALVANGALCWIGSYATLVVLIQSTRFVAWRHDLRRRRRARDAERRGVCLACGYDLRASVWSERCPECGARLG